MPRPILKLIILNGCWLWTSRKDKNGYGIIYIRENVRAHRFSYEYHNKINIGDLLACHKCDNPSCVNPDHIFLGTNLDNTRDREEKGRGYLQNKYK